MLAPLYLLFINFDLTFTFLLMTTQNSFSAPEHITVLLHEAVNGLALKENGIYIMVPLVEVVILVYLSQLSENGRLIAVDRDPRAIAEAEKIQDPRFHIEHNSFHTFQASVKNSI